LDKYYVAVLSKNNTEFKELIENYQKSKFDNPNDYTALANLYLPTE